VSSTEEEPAKNPDGNALRLALISAGALVPVAIVTGVFNLLAKPPPDPPPVPPTTSNPTGKHFTSTDMSQIDNGSFVTLTFHGGGADPSDQVYVSGEFSTPKVSQRLVRLSPPASTSGDGRWTVVWPIEGLPIDPHYYAFIWVGGGTSASTSHGTAPGCQPGVDCLPATPPPTTDAGRAPSRSALEGLIEGFSAGRFDSSLVKSYAPVAPPSQ
jgi:hypothetical protein